MGNFAETAIVDYRLSFADQGKKTSIYRFRLQQQTDVCRNRTWTKRTNGLANDNYDICVVTKFVQTYA
jgi:hypothetical protein